MIEKVELKRRLTDNHEAFAKFISGLSEIVANNALPGKWTPVRQLDHIVKSVTPVTLAFALPKFALRIIFGKSKRSSRSYDELVSTYKSQLAAGAKASARFVPDTRNDRHKLLRAIEYLIVSLNKRMDNFTETELDNFLLPHPILGKLTLREMLYFTIYHVEHHHIQVNRNANNSSAA